MSSLNGTKKMCKEEKKMKGGIFGDLFDFNGDGELDVMEQAMDFMAFNEMMNEDENRDELDDAGFDGEDEF